jgi:hypothetical protein
MPVHRKGAHAIVTLFLDSSKSPPLDAESFTVKEEGEEIKDGVNGEDSDRLDFEHSHVSISLKCFNATADKLKLLVKYNKNLRDDAQPKVQFGLKIKEVGGSTTVSVKDCVIGGWDWASSGRTARQMLNIPIRGRSLEEI